MNARLTTFLTLLFALGATHGIHAQITPAQSGTTNLAELSLEELMGFRIERVFTASRYEQDVTRAPASVSIVTAADIRDHGHRTVSDVLRSMRGIYVSGDRNYDYVGVRGFLRPGDYNIRVLMLIDGHRVNDVIYDAASIEQANIVDIDMIERVEVIRGPSSSIYGSSAFFGVVNMITRGAAQLRGAEFSAEAGTFGTYKARLSYGRKFSESTEAVFNLSWFESDGEERIYYPEFDERIGMRPGARNRGVAERSDGESALRFSGSVRRGPFTLSAYYASSEKQVPTASFETIFNDGRERTVDESAFIDMKFEHEFTPDMRLVARAAFDYYAYDADYPYDFAAPGDTPNPVINKDLARAGWLSTEVQFTARLMERHTIVAGGEFRQAIREEQQSFYDTVPPEYFVDVDLRTRTMGLYAQGEFELLPELLLNAGLRFDHYPDSFGATLNPRLGLIYSPTAATTLKALYGQAFRAPNTYERFYFAENQEALDPERIRTAELVVEHYFGANLSAGLSVYRYEVRDLITQLATTDGDIYFDNFERTIAHGAEVEIAGRFERGIQARASLALQRTEDSTTGGELTSSPRQLARFSVSAPLAGERLRAGLEVQSHGSMRTLDGARTRSFVATNFTLTSRGLVPGLELSASLYNLFDEDIAYPGAADHEQDTLQQPGRTLRLKATIRF